MDSTRALLLGLAAGTGLGAGAVGLLAAPAAPSIPRDEAVAERSTVAVGMSLAAAPPPAPVRDAVLAIDLASWTRDALPTLREQEGVERRLWPTVAACWARLGRKEDVVRACEAGLAAGGNGGDCTWPLSQLPEPARTEALRELRSRHPGAVFDPLMCARSDAAAGSREAAFAGALGVLRGGGPAWVDAFAVLSRLDPARAVEALGDTNDFPSHDLQSVANGLAAAGRSDLAGSWARRALERQAEEQRLGRERAIAKARASVEADPKDPDAWSQIAQLLEDSGDVQGALEAWKRLAQADPLSTEALRGLYRLDPAGSLSAIEAAAPRIDADEVWALLAQAYLYARRGEEAMAAFLRVHSADDYRPWWDAPQVDRVAPSRAAAWFADRMASPRFSHDATYVRAYARALSAIGRRTEAYEFLVGAVPACGPLWEARVETDAARAAHDLEASLRDAPKDAFTETHLARAWASLGVRKDEALAIWRAYLPSANGPEAWTALASLGDAPALALLEDSARSNPEDRDVWWMLSSAYARLGRTDDARAARDRAFAPGFQSAGVEWLVRWCLGD